MRLVLAAFAAASLPAAALAKVHISVDLSSQSMHVESKDQVYDWKVSSGASGYETPNGSYKVLWTDKDHKSDEYDGAPMPNAIFFKPGFAIHGSFKSNWGHPASHGCVRLPVAKSALLFDLVKNEGGAEIEITGNTPPSRAPAPAVAAHTPKRPPVDETYEATTQTAGGPAYYGYEDPYGYEARPRYREAPQPTYQPRQPENPFDGLFGNSPY